MQIEAQPPLPRTIRPTISLEVEAMLLKALAKEPQDRFPSGAALVTALESATSHTTLPETVPQQTIPQRVSLLERPLPPLSVGVNKPDPQPPAVNCHQVGERLTRDGSNRFWKNAFEVFYAGTPVSSCSQAQCVTEIVK
jgi:hypothetical protein